jgi:2-hydroxy-3-keto-5-methylthiopentenyl-1-phosphate phosphatase
LNARTIVVDFDGTITEQDILQSLAFEFGDPEVVRSLDKALDEGQITLRDEITGEYATVRAPLDEVVQHVVQNTRVRAGFRRFVELAHERGWRILIVSSGFHELIEPVLEREGVDVEIYANRLDPQPDGWVVEWRYDDTCEACGQSCKRSTIKNLVSEGEIVYIGDGYSDRCAAEASDRVFATRGLASYLDQRGVPYERFDDFHDITRSLAS